MLSLRYQLYLLIYLSTTLACSASLRAFIQLESETGSVDIPLYEGWAEVLSLSRGAVQPVNLTGYPNSHTEPAQLKPV